MDRLNLSNGHKEILEEFYRATRRTVDDLPYTEEFELLFEAFVARSGKSLSRHDVWRALSSARKASRLVRKER